LLLNNGLDRIVIQKLLYFSVLLKTEKRKEEMTHENDSRKTNILPQYFLANWKRRKGRKKEYSCIFSFIEGKVQQQELRGGKNALVK